jgi:hypothetical protein
MAVVVIVVIALWLIATGVVRTWLHLRAGGARPIRFADRPGSPQWWARLIFSSHALATTIAIEQIGCPNRSIH